MKDVYDLSDKLWRKGWVTSVHVNSGSEDRPKVDIMAVKNGSVAFFDVIQLESGGSTRKVVEEARNLRELVTRASDGQHSFGKHKPGSANGYFAIQKKNLGGWKIAHFSERMIRYKDSHPPFSKVIDIP